MTRSYHRTRAALVVLCFLGALAVTLLLVQACVADEPQSKAAEGVPAAELIGTYDEHGDIWKFQDGAITCYIAHRAAVAGSIDCVP